MKVIPLPSVESAMDENLIVYPLVQGKIDEKAGIPLNRDDKSQSKWFSRLSARDRARVNQLFSKKLAVFQKDKEIFSTDDSMLPYLERCGWTMEDMEYNGFLLKALHIYHNGEYISLGNYIQEYDGFFVVCTENGDKEGSLMECEKFLFSFVTSQRDSNS